jgi:hypothetical protein
MQERWPEVALWEASAGKRATRTERRRAFQNPVSEEFAGDRAVADVPGADRFQSTGNVACHLPSGLHHRVCARHADDEFGYNWPVPEGLS